MDRKESSRLSMKVRRAWISGKIEKLPCEVCHTEMDVQAHHEDYSKPLDVTWLCRKHHKERHKELGAEFYKNADSV